MISRVLRPSPSAATAAVPFASAALGWLAAFVVGGTALAPALTALIDNSASPSIPALAVGLIIMWAAFVVAMVILSRQVGTGQFRQDYAVAFSARDLFMIPLAVGVQLLIPVLYWPLQRLWPATFSDEALNRTATELVERAGGWRTVLLVAAVALGAPIVEELVYRGLLQRSLSAAWQPVAAWVAASAWFALIHFRPVEFPGLMVAGLLFGSGYLLTGRLGPAIVGHITFNATALVIAFQ